MCKFEARRQKDEGQSQNIWQGTRGGKSSELALQKSAAPGKSYLRAAYLPIHHLFDYDITYCSNV